MKKDIDDLRLSKSQEKIIYQTVQPQPQPQVIVKEIEKKTEDNQSNKSLNEQIK